VIIIYSYASFLKFNGSSLPAKIENVISLIPPFFSKKYLDSSLKKKNLFDPKIILKHKSCSKILHPEFDKEALNFCGVICPNEN